MHKAGTFHNSCASTVVVGIGPWSEQRTKSCKTGGGHSWADEKCTGLDKWEKWGCVRSAAAVLRRRPERSVSLDRCSETEETEEAGEAGGKPQKAVVGE